MRRASFALSLVAAVVLALGTTATAEEKPGKMLEVGQGLKISGKLGPGKTSEVYHVRLVQGGTYVIDMVSPNPKALDPFLQLREVAGKVLASDDDGGVGLNARILFWAARAGVYEIVATSYEGKGAGRFGLELRRDDTRYAEALERTTLLLQQEGKYSESLAPARALLKEWTRLRGSEYWKSREGAHLVREAESFLSLPKAARSALVRERSTVAGYNRLAINLQHQQRHAEAETLLRKALVTCKAALGDEHPDVARVCQNLAQSLNALRKHAEAERLCEHSISVFHKIFGGEDPSTAEAYNGLAYTLRLQRRYAAAEPFYRKALDIRKKVLGEEHSETARSYNNLALDLLDQGKYAEAQRLYEQTLLICRKTLGEEDRRTAQVYFNLAGTLRHRGKYAAAEPLFRKALAIRRKVLGENHPETAASYSGLAAGLEGLGRYAEAVEFTRQALAIRRRLLRKEDPEIATSYNNLAHHLGCQGKYAEAEVLYRKSLRIRQKVLGEEDLDTAALYGNLGSNLKDQARYAEADVLLRKSLAIARKIVGEEHRETAECYYSLGLNSYGQARYGDAALFLRKSLELRQKLLGDEHPSTAASISVLALSLEGNGEYTLAEPLCRKALVTREKVLGKGHSNTTASYNNLALILQRQGKYPEAEDLLRKSLDLRQRLGENEHDVAIAYNNLAGILNAQGRYSEAEPFYGKTLAVLRKVLGDKHPHTILCWCNAAYNLDYQGKHEAAQKMWLEAAGSFAVSRLNVGFAGLERVAFANQSPLPPLAASLARSGRTAEAWHYFENSLARGTWDDLAARLRRAPEDRARQTDLAHRLTCLHQLLDKTLAADANPDFKKRRQEWLTEQRKLQDELAESTRSLERKYGPVAGQVFDRPAIQEAIPADAALVAWLDIEGQPKAADPNGEHWGIVLRGRGLPIWVRLPGSGPKEAWTKDDTALPGKLRAALRAHTGEWQGLALALRQLRLAPLEKHLQAGNGFPAVKHLIVLPSTALAGVPVEVFASDYTVSYALSGTLFAHLKSQPKLDSDGLLVLADPVFEPSSMEQASPLVRPPGGIYITHVLPGSNAAKSGLRTGDVLLRYGNRQVNNHAELARAIAEAGAPKEIAVAIWRDGTEIQGRVPPGQLGITLAKDPAPQAIALRRQIDNDPLVRGGSDGDWPDLPGTRFEADALRKLFGSKSTMLLTDSQASEQTLDALARKGELGRYRYVHLATHAEADERFPLRSAVILARDHLPDPFKQWEAGLRAYDGRLTAEEILSNWNLKADMVTLSACETALGKYERGEGFVGFAQALILSGSRSVCLSLWKVDDTATALLMERFYQNLLDPTSDGRRETIRAKRMTKAEALVEAKTWLRNLTQEEAGKRIAALTSGVARAKDRKKQPPLAPPAKTTDERPQPSNRPYAHPYYWAAFVLIGDES